MSRIYDLLRWSERYTRIDMVYAARSSFWVNANFVTVSALALLLSIAFANFLPKEVYGTYQYLFSLYGILTALTFTGMNAALTQAVARGHYKTLTATLKPQLMWNLIPAVVSIGIAGYYYLNGNLVIAIGMLCMAIALPLYNAFNSYTAYLAGTQNFRSSFLYACAVNIPYYLSMYACVYFLRDVLALVLVNLSINTAITIINYVRIARDIPKDSDSDSDAVSYGKSLTYAGFLPTLAGQADNLLVFHFLGAPELAAYALIRLVPERLGGVFKAILAPAFPRLANRTGEEIRSTIIRRSVLVGIAALGVSFLYSVCVFPLFSLIYPAYKGYAAYSAIYSLSILVVIGNFGVTALMAQKRPGALYLLNTVVPISQIVLQALFLYHWGLSGLIAAKLTGVVLMNVIAVGLVRYLR